MLGKLLLFVLLAVPLAAGSIESYAIVHNPSEVPFLYQMAPGKPQPYVMVAVQNRPGDDLYRVTGEILLLSGALHSFERHMAASEQPYTMIVVHLPEEAQRESLRLRLAGYTKRP